MGGLLFGSTSKGQVPSGLEAHLSARSSSFIPGDPVVLDFLLYNTTDADMVLTPPGVVSNPNFSEFGLTLSQVFSGVGFSALTIDGEYGRSWSDAFGYQPSEFASDLHLPARGIVGKSIAIDHYYPAVQRPGKYSIVWAPYGGSITSNRLAIEVTPRKQAMLFTDKGAMTIQFEYDLAPKHVQNFIELARSNAYNNMPIHRIEPGYLFQTGCPNGDGTGKRADGKTLVAEFNKTPIDRGTVCMARLESDPNSASSQFFVTATRIPEWDGRYTVFGKLVGEESLATLDKIMAQPIREDGRPKHRILLSVVRIVDIPPNVRPVENASQAPPTTPATVEPAPPQMVPLDSK